jgi:branched-subunit amino acid transport protein
MNALWQILAMAVGVYALRVTGLALRDVVIPADWERALRFVPVAVLTSLVVTSLAGRGESRAEGIVAAAGAAVVVRKTGKMWLCIASGVAMYLVLRQV